MWAGCSAAAKMFASSNTFVFLFVICIACCSAAKSISLNGQWRVANKNMGYSVSGKVPGSMYTALLNSRSIQDPYYRENDKVYRWIGRDDWTYSRTFTVTADVLTFDSVVLVCEGLDTVATVYINNQTVGRSDNMFVRYVYNIKSALSVGENRITIEFMSAVNYARKQAEASPYIIPPGVTVPTQHGEYHANMIRKEQCSFSWDWGPSFPTQGIWKNISIQAYNSAVIRYVTTETYKYPNGTWRLTVDVFTEVQTGSTALGIMEVKLDNTTVTQSTPVALTTNNNTVRFEINIPATANIKPWWPNGYGDQSLYDLYAFYTDSFGILTSTKVRVGFRTVELVQDYVSTNKSQGRTFYFRINGQPVFFKGSNWVPADSFQERITRDRIYNYLRSAADVHINCLRVWGGGIYESDMFYDIADELGIMIWQDFMFGCSMYPTDPAFLSTVKQEVQHQVRRLKHHPSIVLWAGNNENEKALVQNWYMTDLNYTRYKSDYIKLYIDTIGVIVKREDTSRPWVSSSPSDGIETEQEGGVAKQPWSTHYGDIHDYSYLTPYYDPSLYKIPRFCSEFGWQSYPSLESLEPVYAESDMEYWSDLNGWRQHHTFGNIELAAEIILYLNEPNSPDRKQKFKDMIYATQITQSIAVRTESEHYRRWQNRLDDQGQGHTMGCMYWMLEDIWQAPTWASLEYGGKWKMLHYYARHFFAPTLISPYMDGDDLDVYIVVDELPIKEVRHPSDYGLHFKPTSNPRPFSVLDLSTYVDITRRTSLLTNQIPDTASHHQRSDFAGTLYIEMYSWDNMMPCHTWQIPFEINSTAESVFRRNVDDMITESGCIRRRNTFVYFHLGNKTDGPTNWLALSQFNNARNIQKADVEITDVVAGPSSDKFLITIATNAIAPFVWLEAYGVKGRFSDNGFVLIQQKMTLTFHAWESVDVSRLRSSLTVRSLMDIYH